MHFFLLFVVHMSKSTSLVDFEGAITFDTIEMLLNRLRDAKEFSQMKKPARKRLYSIFVESIDNIYKYGAHMPDEDSGKGRFPRIAVIREGELYSVLAGNLVLNDVVCDLKFKLDRVNQLNDEALKSLYEEVINKESSISDTGAGLGLITMAIRTHVDIRYEFETIDNEYSFFEMKITIKG